MHKPVSLTNARTGKRVRVASHAVPAGSKANRVYALQPGAALVPVPTPLPILGYRYQREHLHVYVNGSMPLDLRSAHEEGRTRDEVWLVATRPAGIQEIVLTDCREDFHILLPQAA
ncbi:MAG TPA: hypothetical protein VF630_08985 [Hymenobacter sp.]